MEERVLLTPLVGAHKEGPVSYLLQIDQTRILLDCGWNEEFDPSVLEPLRKIFPTVNVILISFGDLDHMGGLPYCIREFGMKENCAIYSTAPTKALGLRALFDAYLSRAKAGPFDFYDVDDVNKLEDKIKEVRFEMNVTIKGLSVNPINMVAVGAGRLLGGSMWHIVREPDVILYAVDFSVGKDSLLDGIARKCEKLNPTLLITDSSNYLVSTRESAARRKEALCSRILSALRQGRSKNVVLPVDSTGRTLELLYILNSYWKHRKLSYPIVWVTHIGQGVLDTAKLSLVDYMNSDINASVSRSRKNPFDNLENVKIVASLAEVEALRGPKVILASSSSIQSGPILDLLQKYGTQEGHLFLLTDKTSLPNSIARTFIRHLEENSGHQNVAVLDSRSVNLSVDIVKSQWVYKSDQELVLWKRARRERLQVEAQNRQIQLQAKAYDGDIAMDGMDVLEDTEKEGAVEEKFTRETGEDESSKAIGIDTEESLKSLSKDRDEANTGGGLFSFFAKQGDATRQMFSAFEGELSKRWNEYGEKIDPNDFIMPQEENEELDGPQGSSQFSRANEEDFLDDSGSGSEADSWASEHDGIEEPDHPGDNEVHVENSEHFDDEDNRYNNDNAMKIEGTSHAVSKKKRRSRKKNYGNVLEDAFLPRGKRNDVPRDCVQTKHKLQIRCSVAYVDMESRANGVDAKMIVNILKPRKVVIIHGSAEATKEMLRGLKQLAVQTVAAPAIGETSDVSSDVGMWRLELDRSLFDASYALFGPPTIVHSPPTQERKAGEVFGIRYIEGIVDENEDHLGVIRPLVPANKYNVLTRSVEPLFVHSSMNRFEIYKRLLDHDEQHDRLDSEKILPRMEKGVIFCKESVSVSVDDDADRLYVEGPMSKTFYAVRKLVYQSYHLV